MSARSITRKTSGLGAPFVFLAAGGCCSTAGSLSAARLPLLLSMCGGVMGSARLGEMGDATRRAAKINRAELVDAGG